MKNFQEKRRFRAILESRPVLALLLIMTLVFAWSVMGIVSKAVEASKNKKIAEDKIAELQKNQEKLSADIQNLQTDKGKEAAVREKFGLVKDGEGIIVVVQDKNQPETTAPKQNGFFSFFKNLLK